MENAVEMIRLCTIDRGWWTLVCKAAGSIGVIAI